MKFSSLDVGNKILFADEYYSGDYNHLLYLKRAVDDGSNKSKYYLSVFAYINGNLVQQGYLYFYIDEELKLSNFIGIKVEPQFRNLNIGSFLVACWINLCFDNGYDFLGAHEKQRKPFLLYLLKSFGFDVNDITLYDSRKDVITLCRSFDSNDSDKLLLFKDSKHEKRFSETNVFKSDNYRIIHSNSGVLCLDRVIVPLQGFEANKVRYELLDSYFAEVKTEMVLSKHKR